MAICTYKLNQSNRMLQEFVIPGNEAMTPIAEVHTEISESNHQGILDLLNSKMLIGSQHVRTAANSMD